jgi:hypothetical protein
LPAFTQINLMEIGWQKSAMANKHGLQNTHIKEIKTKTDEIQNWDDAKLLDLYVIR